MKGIKVEHASTVVLEALKSGKLKVKRMQSGAVQYFDPCHLGRYRGVYEPPREVLKRCGYTVRDFRYNRAQQQCCGGGGGLKSNYPNVANAIAHKRVREVGEAGVHVLTAPCPMCHENLKDNSGGTGVQLREWGELVLDAVR